MQCGGGEGLLDGVSAVVCDDGGLCMTHVLLWDGREGGMEVRGREGRRGEGNTGSYPLSSIR